MVEGGREARSRDFCSGENEGERGRVEEDGGSQRLGTMTVVRTTKGSRLGGCRERGGSHHLRDFHGGRRARSCCRYWRFKTDGSAAGSYGGYRRRCRWGCPSVMMLNVKVKVVMMKMMDEGGEIC